MLLKFSDINMGNLVLVELILELDEKSMDISWRCFDQYSIQNGLLNLWLRI
jgi:hypothetical protein